MLHSEIPLLRIIVPLVAGIISGSLLHPGAVGFSALVLSSVLLLIVSVRFNHSVANYLYGFAVTLALFSIGLALYTLEKSGISELEPADQLFHSTVSDYPEEKDNTNMLTVKLERLSAGNITQTVKGSVLLYLRKDIPLDGIKPGDNLIFRATPVPVVNRGNPCEFDYRFYLERRHIRYYAFTEKEDIVSVYSPRYRSPGELALITREMMIGKYRERGVNGNNLAIIAAVTLGEKDLMEPELRDKFVKAGVIHIMAVSGLHVGILSLFIYNMLFFTGTRFKVARVLLTILILWCFAFITGLAPPVLRATIMFSFLQTGKLIKRQVNNINLVLASALIIILFRPSVIFDTGFLLSYAAVLYIIGFYRDLYDKLSFSHWLPDRIWRMAAVTLIAQAGTLPLTIMSFNRFPAYFILSNLIIVPVASLIVITGCLVWLTYPISQVSVLLTVVLDRLSRFTEILTGTAASLPNSSIENIGLTLSECLALFTGITLALYYLLKKRPAISIKLPLAAFIIFVSLVTLKHIKAGRSNELIVYNTYGYSTVGIRNGNLLWVFTGADTIPTEVIRHCSSAGLRYEYSKLEGKPVLISTGEYMIFIGDSLADSHFSNLSADYFILTGTRPFIGENGRLNGTDEQNFIASEAPGSYLSKAVGPLTGRENFWSVRESGAYRQTLPFN